MRQRRSQQFGRNVGANPFSSAGEDINPNAYLSNLSDCMLVLACGLMVALVVAWSVKLPSAMELEQAGEMREVTDLEDITGQQGGEGSGYHALGTVYQDPKTGKLYMIQEEGEGVEVSGGLSQTGTGGDSGSGDTAQGAGTGQGSA